MGTVSTDALPQGLPPPSTGSGHQSLGATNVKGLAGICRFLIGCTHHSYQEEHSQPESSPLE